MSEQPPPCNECGEPCIDAGPGLGWQCVSDKPHPSTDSLRYVDPKDATILELRAQVEANAKDAARYRWLRDENTDPAAAFSKYGDLLFGTELGAAIDAAIASLPLTERGGGK